MPLTGSVAAVSVGMVDGRALCDLDYSEDSTRRGRRERRHDRRRRPGRGAGDGRAHPALPRLARRAARASPRWGSRACARFRSGLPVPRQLIFATGNKHKLREMRELLPGVELEPLPEGVELPPEDGDDFAEIALEKARAAHRGDRAGRRSPTTRGSARLRSTAGPGSTRPATAAPARPTARTSTSSWSRSRQPAAAGRPSTPARWRWSRRTAPSTSSKAAARAG